MARNRQSAAPSAAALHFNTRHGSSAQLAKRAGEQVLLANDSELMMVTSGECRAPRPNRCLARLRLVTRHCIPDVDAHEALGDILKIECPLLPTRWLPKPTTRWRVRRPCALWRVRFRIRRRGP